MNGESRCAACGMATSALTTDELCSSCVSSLSRFLPALFSEIDAYLRKWWLFQAWCADREQATA